jgi:hypothetical protein
MQEAQSLGIKPGSIIRDPTAMNQWAISRAKLRSEYAQTTSAVQVAAKENAARQQAKPSAKKAPLRPATPAKADKPGARFKGDDGTFASWKREMEAGRFTGVDADA